MMLVTTLIVPVHVSAFTFEEFSEEYTDFYNLKKSTVTVLVLMIFCDQYL